MGAGEKAGGAQVIIFVLVLAFVLGEVCRQLIKLRDRVVDLELDIARQKSRISNLEWDK